MTIPPLAIDLSRLLLGPLSSTPRGIDRVELAYAQHFLANWKGDCFALIPTLWGVRRYDRGRALRGVNFLAELWGEEKSASADPSFLLAKRWLSGASHEGHITQAPRSTGTHVRDYLAALGRTGLDLGRSARRTLPGGSIYVNVGQLNMSFAPWVAWLGRRPDVTAVFMLYDTIPLDHPEFVSSDNVLSHRRRFEAVAKHGAAILTISHAADRAIRRHLAAFAKSDIPGLMAHLPIGSEFLAPIEPDVSLSATPYFVVCGTQEPRKNLQVLLKAWAALAADNSRPTPRLLVIGQRSRFSLVRDTIAGSPDLGAVICEIEGLSSAGLRELIAGAKAVLMPSFAEGLGLPILEALALGTDVIASDLPPHREAGAEFAQYLDPNDAAGWADAIRSRAADRSGNNQAARDYVAARTWPSYFAQVEQFLLVTAARHGAPSV